MCFKTGHPPSQCPAKHTGKILHKYGFVKSLLQLPLLSKDQINRLRNKAPPLSEELLTADYYDEIDLQSDDGSEALVEEEDLNPGTAIPGTKRNQFLGTSNTDTSSVNTTDSTDDDVFGLLSVATQKNIGTGNPKEGNLKYKIGEIVIINLWS